MPLDAGTLNTRIRIERRVIGVDAHGQASESWETVATAWALPMPTQGREFFRGGEQQTSNAMMWRLRYRSDVTSLMRVVDLRTGGLTYDIQSVVPNVNQEWVDLACFSGLGDTL